VIRKVCTTIPPPASPINDALRQRRAGGVVVASASTSNSTHTTTSTTLSVDPNEHNNTSSSISNSNHSIMSFEQLKREAANLERQLEEKLSRYQQVAQKLSQSMHSSTLTSPADLSRAEEGLGHGMELEEEAATLQPDVQRLLQRLQDLISGRLSSLATTGSQQAVVKRYREILLDLRQDFEKSVAMVRRAKERHELLGGAAAASGGSGGHDPAMDHLLRERNHIQNSLNTAANVIGQADSIRSDLYGQGRSLRNTQSLMNTLTTNIPGLNHLVDAIRKKRSRDDKIVAGVIASCIVFALWYLLG